MDRRLAITLAVAILAIAAAATLVCFVPHSHSDDSMTATANENECLNFTFPEGGGNIWITNIGGNKPNCEYFMDGMAKWTDFISGEKVEVPGGGKIYVRGKNPSGFSTTPDEYTHFGMDVKIKNETVSASGNVMSLIDGDKTSTLMIPSAYCFRNLFSQCYVLSTAPTLPATRITRSCYYEMFSSCTSLTAAPSLPAKTLANNCYESMFSSCTSLTAAPSLPAETLAENCYRGMFSSCTSLTVAPSLPAETIAENCYKGMFSSCTSLTAAPNLPAKTLANNCYESMFSSCTSLTATLSLPANGLAENCYKGMFSSCTSLTAAPALPATELRACCYESMFSGCTSLTAAPSLPANRLAESCYESMFSGCTSLTAAPALPATELRAYCYDSMFSGCTSLTAAPALPATTLEHRCYQEMFYGCTTLNTVLCFATNVSGTGYTSDWLHGVKSTGNFYTHCDDWQVGASGIPSDWTEHYNDFIAVVFDPMGGTTTRDGKPTENYSIADSSGKIDLPSAERKGQEFNGWYTKPEGGIKIESDKVYTEDTVVYAHWDPGYTLTFDPNGGSGGPSPIIDRGKIILPTKVPTYTGNTCVGWKENGKDTIYSPGSEYNLTANVTLYAVWGGTVTFNPTFGTGEFEPIVKENGGKLTISAIPTHATLAFQGWCDGTAIYFPGNEYTVSGDVTFYAMWGSSELNCIISFDLKGGSDADSSFNMTKVSLGASYTLPSDTPSKTGYSFVEWKCNGTTYTPGQTVTMNKDMEFEARWTINQYTITFNTDGGSPINPIVQDYGTAVTKPAIRRNPDTCSRDGIRLCRQPCLQRTLQSMRCGKP